MALSSRFALDTTAILGGGFLVVSAMSFSATPAHWLAFGVSTAFTIAAAAGAVLARRTHQQLAHGALSLVGLWSLISPLVFTGTTQHWLIFANALALVAVALGDLIAHESTTERVVHELHVGNSGSSRVERTERSDELVA